MFNVESLKSATLATVSICEMVWFSKDAVMPDMVYNSNLKSTYFVALDAVEEDSSLIGLIWAQG
ncbi:hypothetical protein PPACK8108_LOCUS22563 [Phakopsora pachyrhizi]|uniref:Uncharacterized protein n=1 Tax=Phakopsora pachyrhizi TaxID=170000 RepID=A0AAV0BQ56_PHAPC|nr:hypothetical protein PPACK8108_LOCUS22563 [Phakopsora pachyrhizi]